MSADGAAVPELSCPFCAEPIRPAAVACPHCTRDLSIPLPLMLRQRAQEREIEALQAEIAELRRAVEVLPAAAAVAPVTAVARFQPWVAPALGWLAALALLLGAHGVLVIRHDAAVVVLRAACIGLPFVVALVTPGLWSIRLASLVGAGLALGSVAVLGMFWAVNRVDGTPVLPTNARDLFEAIEFALSIALSFLAGALVRRLVRHRRDDRRATLRANPGDSIARVAEQTVHVSRAAETVGLAMTAAAALIAGFRTLIQ